MISRLAVLIVIFGWVLFFSHISMDYMHYRGMVFQHYLKPDNPFEHIFHLEIISFLAVSHLAAHLIQQRKRLLHEVRVSRDELSHILGEWRTTLDSLPYGVMLVNKEFNIIRANRYISELSGIPLGELNRYSCYEVVHRGGIPDNCPIKRSILSRSSEFSEFYDEPNDRYFIHSATPVLDGNEIRAFAYSMIDVTELRKKERVLQDSRDAFFNILLDLNEAYNTLKETQNSILIAFSNAIDAKSPWTKGHSERVTMYAMKIAGEMGIDEDGLNDLRIGGLLHDIGKIGTYDVILDKPSRLTDEEFSVVRMHPVNGERIIKPIKGLAGILPIIRSHHERYDGKGYPDGLKGEDIPLLARILCVADSYDSMTSDRPYRPSPGREYAIMEIKRCSGTQFDPRVVDAFMRVIEKERGDK